MDFRIPQEVQELMSSFVEANYEIYIVGGAVRDLSMGKPVVDWDFTTNATPEQITKLLPDSFYNNDFGTVGIEPKDESYKPHEITTFRTEKGYSDFRRPDSVEWGKSLEEDLKRRDFTINAMAIDSKGQLIDHFDGQNDLDKKLVRAVGNADERFREDALRMMRAVRIASEIGFKIEEGTLNAIKSDAALIHKIAAERVHDELIKLLSSPNPYTGILLLRETGLLAEILPELEATFGVDQVSPNRHHIYDVGTHLLMTLKATPSEDPITRFAALIHDIGKPKTLKKRGDTLTFYNHEVVGARIAKRIAERLKFSKKETDKLWRLVRYHQFTVDEHQTDSALRRFIKNVTPEYLEDMLALRTGDRIGSGARETSWRTEEFKARLVEVQKQPFTVHDLKITGDDVMRELDLKPSPEVGKILTELFEQVVEKKVANKKADLLKKLAHLRPQ